MIRPPRGRPCLLFYAPGAMSHALPRISDSLFAVLSTRS